ncbi:helix-turn-helix domain-containing protein [Peterkaempfera bronchialis]|uniref:XRE family transcriptional regulator n=1 Tax=Peterkaempfera bronchialis TaxID=2126346 RepID=A0A345SX92_9ACTN|nr:helix-turn-helix transcriptional regulator [Peterkaempfera bronchialis]AXI78347.1 XRE family transcriptional regulator [Peterkaempfera bronchialis]
MAQSPTPTVRRRRLGVQMRQLRGQANLTLDQVAEATGWDRAKISRLENGRSGIRLKEIKDLLTLYRVDDPGLAAALECLAREGSKRGWWQNYSDVLNPAYADFISLETDASRMCEYQVTLIPGLFQTTPYAREVIAAINMGSEPDEVNRLAELRAARQSVLTRSGPPLSVWAIIHEAALRQRTVRPNIMRDQLRRLLEIAELPHVTIQVLPLTSTPHPGVAGAFTLLSFAGTTGLDVALAENLTGAVYIEEEREVSVYVDAFERLRASALPTTESSELIDRLADTHRLTEEST